MHVLQVEQIFHLQPLCVRFGREELEVERNLVCQLFYDGVVLEHHDEDWWVFLGLNLVETVGQIEKAIDLLLSRMLAQVW